MTWYSTGAPSRGFKTKGSLTMWDGKTFCVIEAGSDNYEVVSAMGCRNRILYPRNEEIPILRWAYLDTSR